MRPVLALVLLACAANAEARFVVHRTVLTSGQYREVASELEGQRVLQEISAELNKVLTLPTKVGLRFAECGEANSFYDTERRMVTMCLELIDSVYESARQEGQTEEELDDIVAGVFAFFLFHEVAHALIDVLEIPIAGREEDAADQLSAWLLIDNGDGDKSALDAASSFYFDSQWGTNDDESAFADEHSLDKQRYFNILCWVYGSDPEAYSGLVDDELLPEARADQCAGEYELVDRSWKKLLSTHVKD